MSANKRALNGSRLWKPKSQPKASQQAAVERQPSDSALQMSHMRQIQGSNIMAAIER